MLGDPKKFFNLPFAIRKCYEATKTSEKRTRGRAMIGGQQPRARCESGPSGIAAQVQRQACLKMNEQMEKLGARSGTGGHPARRARFYLYSSAAPQLACPPRPR